MGANNRAEHAIARIEFREDLAKLYHEAFRRPQSITAPWRIPGLAREAASIRSRKRACGVRPTAQRSGPAGRHCIAARGLKRPARRNRHEEPTNRVWAFVRTPIPARPTSNLKGACHGPHA